MNISLSNLNKEQIKNNIDLQQLLDKIKPLSFYLYGSFAKNKQNCNSDIDFMIIFKNNLQKFKNIDKIFSNIKKYILNIFKRNIDLVVMVHKKKLQYFENDLDPNTNFIYNVYNEGINIYGKNDNDLIIESIKYGKY